jgi:ferredoxin
MSLLDFAEQLGLTPDFSCRQGQCQSCETGVLEGSVTYESPPAASPAPGRALLCCARPQTSIVTLDL